nr:hypothetical protein [Tanacetum cinerariifolium]
DLEDSLIMGNEDLNTNPEKESDEFIKSSVEDLVPIPTVTFSNPLFNSNDDFISSNDESLSDEDVSEDNVKIYSNPLFEFDDEYISSDVHSFFDEVLKDIGCKDSYDPNLDELTFLVTPLSDSNKDEYFTPSDDIELLFHHDPSIPMMSISFILEGFNDEPPLKENDDLFDLESKNNEWKKIFYDAAYLGLTLSLSQQGTKLPPKYDDNLQFDIEFDLKEMEFLLYQDKDSSLKDSIDQKNLVNLADIFVDSIPEMFTDEHALHYSSPLIFDEYDDDFLEVESDTKNVYDDPFDSKGEKIKESKLLIDELDLPCDFLPFEYDSFISRDFSRVDALP